MTGFQKNKNLEVDGIVGPATRTALKNAINTSTITTSQTINGYLYTTSNVYLRNGPSTNYDIKSLLNQNTKVYVYQIRADGWAYAKWNNTYGYIYSKYLSSTIQTTTTTSSLPTFQRNNTSLLGIIKACKTYYASNNFSYNLADGTRTIPADQSKLYNGSYAVDCSSYVTWVLYEYALANGKTNMKNYFSYQRNSATFAQIGANGGNDYLSVVSKKGTSSVNLALAKEGDILVSNGHVEFFSSYTQNGNTVSLKVYNCGSNASIQMPGISTSATKNISDITYILRVR